MQEKFTQKAQKALLLAGKAARQLNQGYIGTEHILVGLIRENTGTAAQVLLENGVDLVLGGHSHVLQPAGFQTVTLEDGTQHTGFVSYSLGNFISSQNDPLTDVTAVLTMELTKNMVTGETTVTDWKYQPMLMLDREKYPERFELLDVYR